MAVKTLTDRIKDAGKAPAPTGDPGGSTSAIRRLMQAKSGQQAAPGGVQKSTLGEAQAIGLGQAQLQQQAAQAELGQEALTSRAQELDTAQSQQQQMAAQQQENVKKNFNIKSDQILQQYADGVKRIESQRDIARMEQMGFSIRLRNDKYVNKIQQIGAESRLEDEAEFKKQIAQKTFSDNEALFENKLAAQTIMNADQREFESQLADMELSFAIQVAESAAKQEATRQTFEGVQGAFSGGVKAYGNIKK